MKATTGMHTHAFPPVDLTITIETEDELHKLLTLSAHVFGEKYLGEDVAGPIYDALKSHGRVSQANIDALSQMVRGVAAAI